MSQVFQTKTSNTGLLNQVTASGANRMYKYDAGHAKGPNPLLQACRAPSDTPNLKYGMLAAEKTFTEFEYDSSDLSLRFYESKPKQRKLFQWNYFNDPTSTDVSYAA
eukprot:137293_1